MISASRREAITPKNLATCLKSLESKLRNLDIRAIRIGKCGEITDSIPKGVFNEGLRKFLGGLDLTITMCSGACRPIPEEERKWVIQDHHDSLFGGHRGIEKIYRCIRERFYWKGMKQEIHDFVKRCEICQMQKLTRVKGRGYRFSAKKSIFFLSF